ncbi:MAG: hypothetical protein ACREOC_01510 [Gemmatimonadales bacterium]
MNSEREFRQVTFGRGLSVKRLQAALARTTKDMMKDPAADAAPARVERVLVEGEETTVFLSGNGPGLDAVAAAVRRAFSDATVSTVYRGDVERAPRVMAPPERTRKRPR